LDSKKRPWKKLPKQQEKPKAHFIITSKNKEEIFQAVIEQEAEVLRERIKKAISQENTPQDKLRAYIITRMKALKQLANFYSAIKDEYLENYKFIEKFRGKYDEEEKNTISQILKEGIAKGIFKVKDVEITTTAILIALKGFEAWIFRGNTRWTEKDIDNLLEILFYGITRK